MDDLLPPTFLDFIQLVGSILGTIILGGQSPVTHTERREGETHSLLHSLTHSLTLSLSHVCAYLPAVRVQPL